MNVGVWINWMKTEKTTNEKAQGNYSWKIDNKGVCKIGK